MQLTYQYYSAATNNSDRPKSKIFVSPLAQASFNAFESFINVFEPGASFDGPYHSISKQDWDFYRRHKAGEKPLFYDDGTKFNPYVHVIRQIYSPEHVQNHIVNNDTSYYTSGKNGLGLLYLDLDSHKPWQIDETQGKILLQNLFPFGYFRTSTRGQNGYLKIRYSSIEEFNEVATQLQAALRQLFLQSEILCDIEVKGTITHKGKSGLLAKLPFTTKLDQYKRDDTDSWDGQQLDLFTNCPIVNLRRVEQIAKQIENYIDEDKVARFSEQKDKIEHWHESRAKIIQCFRDHGFRGSDQEVFSQAEKIREQQRQSTSQTESTLIREVKDTGTQEGCQPPALVLVTGPSSQYLAPHRDLAKPSVRKMDGNVLGLAAGGDAFSRNLHDLLPFIRDFYKTHRTLPTLDDALSFLQKNGLFSGNWNDNEDRRVKRVSQILEFLFETFDSKLLGTDESQPVSLSVGKFAWWVQDRIGTEMTADVINHQAFDPVTLTAPAKRVSVPAKFIATFLAVADFCLNQDPLENKAVPTNRIKELWKMVVGGAPWNQTYFQVVRDRLNKMGVINIFDRNHEVNKAWKWEAGPNFPADNWRLEQQKLAERVKRSRFGLSYKEFIANTIIVMNDKVHNTLYKTDASFLELWDRNSDIRPPPT